jgi:methylmalonyl-CoA mutase N-terminal domain/subunit
LSVPLLRIDERIEAKQVQRVRALRARRDQPAVDEALVRIEAAAASSVNLMPLFLEAVEKLATVGEICDALRRVWGEYREPELATP